MISVDDQEEMLINFNRRKELWNQFNLENENPEKQELILEEIFEKSSTVKQLIEIYISTPDKSKIESNTLQAAYHLANSVMDYLDIYSVAPRFSHIESNALCEAMNSKNDFSSFLKIYHVVSRYTNDDGSNILQKALDLVKTTDQSLQVYKIAPYDDNIKADALIKAVKLTKTAKDHLLICQNLDNHFLPKIISTTEKFIGILNDFDENYIYCMITDTNGGQSFDNFEIKYFNLVLKPGTKFILEKTTVFDLDNKIESIKYKFSERTKKKISKKLMHESFKVFHKKYSDHI